MMVPTPWSCKDEMRSSQGCGPDLATTHVSSV